MNTGATMNVLLVEGDERLRVPVSSRLRRGGHDVIESPSAESAMDLLQSDDLSVDVIVTDTSFQTGRDGFFLAEWVRRRYPKVAIAVTSRSVRFSTAVSQLADGAAFVEKPYDVDALVSFLQELVQERADFAA